MTGPARAAIVFSLLLVFPLRAQNLQVDNSLAREADAFLKAQLTMKRIPGMSVCVVRRGKVELASGYGFANVELRSPASEHTAYELASLTKPFTAIAVLMLIEEGKISLEDPLPRYFPGAPASWKNISVEQLLHHTSGLGDFFSIPELQSRSGFAWEREYLPTELLPILFRVPISFQPGEKFSYSNVGYYLLGMIIERASGEPYESFLKNRIFVPLGMTQTRRMSRRDIIPERASGYTWENNILLNAKYTSVTWAYSEGGLVSSVFDLAKADAGLFGDKLLKRSTLERMWQPYRLNDGTLAKYGIGWNLASDPHLRQIYHSGNKPGFASIVRRYIDDSLTVIVLANVDNTIAADADVGAISYHVASIFLRARNGN